MAGEMKAANLAVHYLFKASYASSLRPLYFFFNFPQSEIWQVREMKAANLAQPGTHSQCDLDFEISRLLNLKSRWKKE